MVGSCAAFNCTARYSKKSDLPFHSFPTDPVLKEKWILATRRINFTVTKHTKLCGKHFVEEDYRENTRYKMLKLGVIPSVFDFSKRIQRSNDRPKRKQNKRTALRSLKSIPSSPDNLQEVIDRNNYIVESEHSKPTVEKFISEEVIDKNDYIAESEHSKPTVEKFRLEEVIDRNDYIVESEHSKPTVEKFSLEEVTDRNDYIAKSEHSKPTVENFSFEEVIYRNDYIIDPEYSIPTVEKFSFEEVINKNDYIVGPEYCKSAVEKFTKRKRYVYPGDFTMSDMKDSNKAMLMYKIMQQQNQKQRMTIKQLRKQNMKLLNRVENIQNLLKHLQESTKVSPSCFLLIKKL